VTSDASRHLPNAIDLRALRLEIEEFNTDYAEALDSGDLEKWTAYFTDDALYTIIARDNADAGLPASLVYCEGKGMLKDRAFAILNTTMFAPRYIQHFVANVRVIGVDQDGIIAARANYLLLETLADGHTRIQQSGRYRDKFVRRGADLLLAERACVYDTLTVHNSLVYPV
jgi:anthranilate 1,2-dioxygenase small subunit